MKLPAFQGNIGFNAQHAPMGAFLSFTLGHFDTRGGIGLEIGKPASQSIFIGVKDGDRFSDAPLRCLPFYRDGSKKSGEEFLVEQAGPAEQNVKPNVAPFPREQIRREYGWATDRWAAGDLEFSIYTPFGGIPDPDSASREALRDALLPAIVAELVIDNSKGAVTKTAVFAIQFDTPGVRAIDLDGSAKAFALHDRLGFAAQLSPSPGTPGEGRGEGSGSSSQKDPHPNPLPEYREREQDALIAIQRWDIDAALRDPNPLHQLGTTAGFACEVPAGQVRKVRIAIGCFLRDVVTTRLQGRYLYTRYFSSLEDVLTDALNRFDARRAAAEDLDRKLLTSGLSPDQQFQIAHATRSYYGSTQLLEIGNEPFWVVNEGEYCMMNTLDLSIDHVFWELDRNPWLVRNQLDRFAEHYSYTDDCGVSFAHDMGAHNNFSAPGTSSYELPHLKGCFSFMTQEQLCNWILMAACYVAKTNDLEWLNRNAPLLDQCADSMRRRADPRTGIMERDSSRCQGGWEITTYDSLDESLGQARANSYLAVKCWASWVGLRMLSDLVAATPASPLRTQAPERDAGVAATYADRIAQALIEAAGDDGVIPAVLEPDNPGCRSRILPVIEALVYPAYWRACGKSRACVADPSEGKLISALRRHTIALLDDPQHRNRFDDGGIKLSSTSDNSWMSKIALFQYVAREILRITIDPRADAAHVRWQTDGSGYWACSDQFVSGIAKGSRYYPRIITAALWMTERHAPPVEVKTGVAQQRTPEKSAL